MIEQCSITSREEWLEWRKLDVTASVIGALFDVHPYTTSLRIYAEKRGVEFPEQEDNAVMRRGRWLEPAVGKAVGEMRPDWKLELPGVYLRDPDIRLGATPDFYIHGDARGLGVLQAKTVAPSVYARDWLGGSEVPLWIVLQCATEMMLADAAFGAVAVLLVDPHQMECKIHELPRNPSAEHKIRVAVKQFWDAVEIGQEPEPDFGRDADVIKAMTPKEIPGKQIDLAGNNELPTMLEERAGLMDVIKRADERKDEIENEIRFLMNDAETANGLPGWRITYKIEHRDSYTVPAKDPRVLRIKEKRAQ